MYYLDTNGDRIYTLKVIFIYFTLYKSNYDLFSFKYWILMNSRLI
jgi:hypothetical protein